LLLVLSNLAKNSQIMYNNPNTMYRHQIFVLQAFYRVVALFSTTTTIQNQQLWELI